MSRARTGTRLGRATPILLCLLVAVFVLAGRAHALQPDEILPDSRLEARAREISAEVRCLVCQNQSIDDSDAPLARDLRILVRERLVAGDSDAAVRDFVVARYGEFVLLRPPFGARTLLLWFGPLLIVGAAILYLASQRRRRAVAVTSSTAPLTEEEEARLRAVLGTDGR